MIHAILIVTGCVENMSLPPLKAQFQLLDVSDNPTNSFREGEDIIFDYQIVNSGKQGCFMGRHQWWTYPPISCISDF